MPTQWFRSRRFWLTALVAALLVTLGSQLPLEQWFNALKAGLTVLGPLAAPVFIALYLAISVLGLPNLLLMLLAGALFGLLKGAVTVSIADTFGAIVCFGIGRTIARQRIKRWIEKNPTFAQLDQAVSQKGWKVLLLTRLSPLVPSNVLNYGFSCTRVNFWQYVFFSWLGMLPIIILYVYLGSFGSFLLTGGLTPQKVAIQGIGLLVTIVAAVYTTRFARKSLQPSCPDSEPSQPSRSR